MSFRNNVPGRFPDSSHYNPNANTNYHASFDLLASDKYDMVYGTIPSRFGTHVNIREEKPDAKNMGFIEIEDIDLNIKDNAVAHHTDLFDVTENYYDEVEKRYLPPQLVVRRGQPFTVTLHCQRPYNPDTDDFVFYFNMGPNPVESNGSSVTVVVNGDNDSLWEASLRRSDNNTVSIEITPPADSCIGKWGFFIETVLNQQSYSRRSRYISPYSVIILYNAWCKDDAVYMKDDEARDEYVLNDTGKLFVGTQRQIGSRPWNFGQFEDVVLNCVLWLIDNKSGLSYKHRGNPVLMSRRISALVNSQDDKGVLTGRWDGSYSDGASPSSWVGSVSILRQYFTSKQPVKYGQCWIFSGVVTTMCRCLGIPARSVSNFSSAHDTDGSITIDFHYDEEGSPLDYLNKDSIWNFHVWNDVWMSRKDLPDGYGGWQVIDATPQETSDGLFCAGPCSLAAIKEGNVSLGYDGPFVFAEVNADRINWIASGTNTWKKTLQKSVVGKHISTKRIGKQMRRHYGGEEPDREDITNQYKHPEGSEKEREAIYRASASSSTPGIYPKEDKSADVTFIPGKIDSVLIGSDFNIPVKMANLSSEERTVQLTITCVSVYYTGVARATVKQEKRRIELDPREEFAVAMTVSVEDYLGVLVDHSAMALHVLASVRETGQTFAFQDLFRLTRPDLQFDVPETVELGTTFEVAVSLTNPLPIPLTKCKFFIEGPGLLKSTEVPIAAVLPGAEAAAKVRISGARRLGTVNVMGSLDCKELPDITGHATLSVIRNPYSA